VEVEEKGFEYGGPFRQEGLIAALADVDYALGDHLGRPARMPRRGQWPLRVS
jgi:hypothetical protein